MSKPMIYTVPGLSTSAIVDRSLLEQDGSGEVKLFDGTGSVIGVANADMDGQNNVAMLTKGLKKIAVSASATYSVGDKLGVAAAGAAAYSSGTVLGRAAETKVCVTSDLLLVEVDIQN